MERVGCTDINYVLTKPQMNVVRCMKLTKLSDESSLEDLAEHFVQELCKYRRFRCHFTQILNMYYFREIEDDEVLRQAVQVLPGDMTEEQVLRFMEKEQDV